MSKKASSAKRTGDFAYVADSPENVIWGNSPFEGTCRSELKEMEKHELICKISQILGPSPANFCKAEMIFDVIKFDLAKYIIHHEYDSPHGVSTDLLLWLDSKIDPSKAKCVSDFFNKYLKHC